MRYISGFAPKINAVMNLIHVYNLPPIENVTLRNQRQLKLHAQPEQLKSLKTYFNKYSSEQVAEANTTFHVEESNSVTAAILVKAADLQAGLVVVGRKGKQSKRGLLAGNIANALMDKLSCPLLVVPNNLTDPLIRNIVYASDFEADDIIVLSQLKELAESFNALIHVVHIPVRKEYSSTEQMEWFKELLTQRLGPTNIEFHLLLSEDVTDGLHLFIEGVEADLLCMLERDEKGFFSKFLRGDTVKRMKSICDIPILIYNRKSVI